MRADVDARVNGGVRARETPVRACVPVHGHLLRDTRMLSLHTVPFPDVCSGPSASASTVGVRTTVGEPPMTPSSPRGLGPSLSDAPRVTADPQPDFPRQANSPSGSALGRLSHGHAVNSVSFPLKLGA